MSMVHDQCARMCINHNGQFQFKYSLPEENQSMDTIQSVKSVKCYPGGRKSTSFHQYLRYCHKCNAIVFSIPGAIL